MNSYVLDTSVVIKWFSKYDEDDLDKALSLRNSIQEGLCIITVPDLLFCEVSNALRYNPHFTESDVKDALQSLYDMGFDTVGVEKEILHNAIEIAFKYNVTVYDASFLAISMKLNKAFVTADYKFFERIKDFHAIVKLTDL
ncbi:MAG: type II toxin-antitoxin system VapC family toxin [Proteobacteria bacterium]|nr:type II toxin-antitoxin system VapC family toxin [Pseudomonadota bacterium]